MITTAFYYLQVKLIKDICNSCKKLFQESDEVLWYVERGRCYCYHQNCNKGIDYYINLDFDMLMQLLCSLQRLQNDTK